MNAKGIHFRRCRSLQHQRGGEIAGLTDRFQPIEIGKHRVINFITIETKAHAPGSSKIIGATSGRQLAKDRDARCDRA